MCPRSSCRGILLVPCLCMMGLISLLALGMLRVGGVETGVAAALTQRSLARQAALAGIQLAYERLAANPAYAGETCAPFEGKPQQAEVSVTSLDAGEYEVLSNGSSGSAQFVVRTRACLRQDISLYPLCVGGDLTLNGPDPLILADCFVNGIVWAKCRGYIAGNLTLAGSRVVQTDADGNPVAIDGYNIPGIGGRIITDAPPFEFPSVDLSALRSIAAASGQLYSGGNQMFRNVDFQGVVYVENASNVHIKNIVTIQGVLVCDNVNKIHVHSEYLKISSGDICPNVALLAPNSNLHVNPNARIEVSGLCLVEESAMHGDGTFSGPFLIEDGLTTYPHSVLCCQCPASMREFVYSMLEFDGVDVVELGYEEP